MAANPAGPSFHVSLDGDAPQPAPSILVIVGVLAIVLALVDLALMLNGG